MLIELVLQVSIQKRLLGGHDRPDGSVIGQFWREYESCKPQHGAVPVNIISPHKSLRVSQVIIPDLISRRLIQIPDHGIDAQIQACHFSFYQVESFSGCEFSSNSIYTVSYT